jgi:DNA-binding NtrC family response regulator
MRILSSARIVVLDGCSEHRPFLCSSLERLGMANVLPAESLHAAQQIGAERAPQLCIVDPRRLAPPVSSPIPHIPANPFRDAGTPGILIAEDASREMLKEAVAAGYGAIVSLPVVPRLLYRRIGSILQRVRRTDRRNGLRLAAGGPLLGPEFQEG